MPRQAPLARVAVLWEQAGRRLLQAVLQRMLAARAWAEPRVATHFPQVRQAVATQALAVAQRLARAERVATRPEVAARAAPPVLVAARAAPRPEARAPAVTAACLAAVAVAPARWAPARER
jgi:hypothetical protein